MKIKFKKLHPDAKPPTRARHGDAGWDLTCHGIRALDGNTVTFGTGIAVEIPEGYFGLLRPRSSIRTTDYVMATSGVIDSGYRGGINTS
jgi:dUTP pyrophosphatase